MIQDTEPQQIAPYPRPSSSPSLATPPACKQKQFQVPANGLVTRPELFRGGT